MVCFFPVNFSPASRRFPAVILACFWVCGLIAGTFITFSADGIVLSVMRMVPVSHVSIVSLLLALLLPLLISAFAVFISQKWLFYPLAYLEGFRFSYVAVGLIQSYGSAGWLVCILFMLSSSLSLVVLFWFRISSCRYGGRKLLCSALGSLLLIASFGLLDYIFISPFLVNLLCF